MIVNVRSTVPSGRWNSSHRPASAVGWPSARAMAQLSLTLRWKMNEPALYPRTVLLQPNQELCRRLVRVLADRMNFVAGFKVGYVFPQAFPYGDPLGPQIIKYIHVCCCMLSIMHYTQR